ncbi:MAG TPA: thioesterase family protein [Wenzhouxiangellaceae bacterium]|nr:thioesterase family protein [Wenzhouxiangellaceae bacterium]
MSEFRIELDVRWGDVDSFGHVNNAVFLGYLEECRSQWMDSVPCHWQDGDAGPVVANININYRRPIHWPERVAVTLKPDSPGRSSIKLESEIRSVPAGDGGKKGAKDKPVLYADATVTLVWIDKKSGESVPLPGSIRDLAHRA